MFNLVLLICIVVGLAVTCCVAILCKNNCVEGGRYEEMRERERGNLIDLSALSENSLANERLKRISKEDDDLQIEIQNLEKRLTEAKNKAEVKRKKKKELQKFAKKLAKKEEKAREQERSLLNEDEEAPLESSRGNRHPSQEDTKHRSNITSKLKLPSLRGLGSLLSPRKSSRIGISQSARTHNEKKISEAMPRISPSEQEDDEEIDEAALKAERKLERQRRREKKKAKSKNYGQTSSNSIQFLENTSGSNIVSPTTVPAKQDSLFERRPNSARARFFSRSKNTHDDENGRSTFGKWFTKSSRVQVAPVTFPEENERKFEAQDDLESSSARISTSRNKSNPAKVANTVTLAASTEKLFTKRSSLVKERSSRERRSKVQVLPYFGHENDTGIVEVAPAKISTDTF